MYIMVSFCFYRFATYCFFSNSAMILRSIQHLTWVKWFLVSRAVDGRQGCYKQHRNRSAHRLPVLTDAHKFFCGVYPAVGELGGVLGACLISPQPDTFLSDMVVPVALSMAMHLPTGFSVPFSVLDPGRLKYLHICCVSKGVFLFQFALPELASII